MALVDELAQAVHCVGCHFLADDEGMPEQLRRRQALGGIQFETPVEEIFEVERRRISISVMLLLLRTSGRSRRWFLQLLQAGAAPRVADVVDDGDGVVQLGLLRLPRQLPGVHLVHDAAQRPDVAREGGARLAAAHLGAHVEWRAEDLIGILLSIIIMIPLFGIFIIAIIVAIFVTRQEVTRAEIRDLDAALGRDEDVCRLEVAVHDALLMQVLEGEQQLQRVEPRRVLREAVVAQDVLAQAAAGDVLEVQAVAVGELLPAVEADDALVVDLGEDVELGKIEAAGAGKGGVG